MRFKRICVLFLLLALLCACGNQAAPEAAEAVTFTDAMGYAVTLHSWERVVSLYGSFAEAWVLAGGTLCATTSDAIEERGLPLGADVAVIGSVRTPNMEEIIAAGPDFVILSADVSEHTALHTALSEAGIPHAYYRVDTYQEYLDMMRQFCGLTGREDLWEKYGEAVGREIASILEKTAGARGPSVLLVRAFSTGAKAKGDDNLAGVILRDLGADNLVSRYGSLLQDLSMEEVIAADPEYIFITTMGDEDKALAYMRENFESNPAWAGLTAVKSGNYIVLPRELFHYKPNARWGESYAYLAEILYPEIKF